MPAHNIDRSQAQQALNMLAACGGNASAAARKYGVERMTIKHRAEVGGRWGMVANDDPINSADNVDSLRARIRLLEGELAATQKKSLTEALVRTHIIGLADSAKDMKPPAWTLATEKPSSKSPGVPTLFLSDLHWGEVVHPSQINGVNKYDMATAKERLAVLAERTVRLLEIISPKLEYPGIVLALGGDNISGGIHEELATSDELPTIPVLLDLFGELCGFIAGMADKFGAVFVPAVTGNHGRNTHKIYAKNRQHTSYDWLLYQLLRKHFENDARVTFLVPDGPDAYYRIYQHRFLLSHGDQFRGGDGMIGALGPIIRGDHKKRSRNGQIDMEYDTLMLAHWHQYIHLMRLIVNGSLKGYDEYAYSNNFGFEPPMQALFITHPKYRITYRAPVYVDRRREPPKTAWVSVAA